MATHACRRDRLQGLGDAPNLQRYDRAPLGEVHAAAHASATEYSPSSFAVSSGNQACRSSVWMFSYTNSPGRLRDSTRRQPSGNGRLFSLALAAASFALRSARAFRLRALMAAWSSEDGAAARSGGTVRVRLPLAG